jgi:class 3 adenylate cyclase
MKANQRSSRFGRTHDLNFRLRILGMSALSVVLASLLRDGLVPSLDARFAFTLMFVWPFAMRAIGYRFPSDNAANVIALTDGALFFLWPVYQWSPHMGGTFAALVVVNFGVSFGAIGIVIGLAICAASAALGVAVVGDVTRFAGASSTTDVLAIATVLAYQTALGLGLHGVRRTLSRTRAQLRTLTADLEARVADRTAALASTNAAIQRFVPREFLHALGHDDVTTTKLGDATAKSITVLFADIRNFTSSSEGMSPEETFAFLNGCLSNLGPHVRAQSGFVDKYIGDAIMALFPRDPSDAVRAAVAMQEELRRTNEGAGDRVPLAIGVGIHVGRVMMGTIGEAERFEATVISDAVNLTARLESLTKQLGCSVLVSEEVHATLGEDLRAHTRRLGTFVVKGKAQPVTIHEVFASDPESLREAKVRTRARFEAMLEAFAEGRVEAALAVAGELRDACPEDGPAAWWFMRLVKESATGDDAVPSSRGIVRLEEK